MEPVHQEALGGNFGEVVLSYVQPLDLRDDEEELPSFQVSARFVNVRDIGRHDLRSLWVEQFPQTSLPRGECEQTSDELWVQQQMVLDGSLDLLDAGVITLHTEDEEEVVPDWSFPSVYGVVGGVFYSGDDVELGYRPGQAYELSSGGSGELGAFEVELFAPEPFEGLTIGGIEVGVEPLVLETPQPIELRWSPGRGTNEIVIEVSYSLFGGDQRILCRSGDDGLEEIPQARTSALWEPGVSNVRLTLYRITRTTFEAEGLDDAEALFVVSAVVSASI